MGVQFYAAGSIQFIIQELYRLGTGRSQLESAAAAAAMQDAKATLDCINTAGRQQVVWQGKEWIGTNSRRQILKTFQSTLSTTYYLTPLSGLNRFELIWGCTAFNPFRLNQIF